MNKELKKVQVSPRKGPKIDGRQFTSIQGLNKKHLEVELLLEDGKEFTIDALKKATNEKYWNVVFRRVKKVCKERGYRLHKVRMEKLNERSAPRQVYKMLKQGDET